MSQSTQHPTASDSIDNDHDTTTTADSTPRGHNIPLPDTDGVNDNTVPASTRHVIRTIASEHETTYSNNDAVTVKRVSEHTYKTRITFDAGTVISTSTVQAALDGTAYTFDGLIVHASGSVQVAISRDS